MSTRQQVLDALRARLAGLPVAVVADLPEDAATLAADLPLVSLRDAGDTLVPELAGISHQCRAVELTATVLAAATATLPAAVRVREICAQVEASLAGVSWRLGLVGVGVAHLELVSTGHDATGDSDHSIAQAEIRLRALVPEALDGTPI